jgi:ATP-dependent DNA helicase RecQ
MRERGVTVVLSPLIALIRDQQRRMDEAGIPCLSFFSQIQRGVRRHQRELVESGQADLVLITPETLGLDKRLRSALVDAGVALMVVDEGHAYEEWAHSFRPAYRRVGGALARFGEPRVLVCSATLSATAAAEAAEALGRWEWNVITEPPARPNLQYVGRQWRSPWDVLRLVDEAIPPGIVYATAARSAENLHAAASRLTDAPVDLYHGRLGKRERNEAQARWMAGTRWMVATKAFGMGIDRPDVRCVAHAELPASISDYAQEAGRAGRDGLPALCALNSADRGRVAQFLVEQGHPSVDRVRAVYDAHPDSWEKLSASEVARRTGLRAETVRSARGWLVGAGMMDTRPADRSWRIEVDELGVLALPTGTAGARMRAAATAVEAACRPVDGGLAATADELADAMAPHYRDWRGALRRLQDHGALRAVAPTRAGWARRRGVWSDFNPHRLTRSRQRAMDKLSAIREFAISPNSMRAGAIDSAIFLDAALAEDEIKWRREETLE